MPKRFKTTEPNLVRYENGSYGYRRGDFEESLGSFPSEKLAIEYKRHFEAMKDQVGIRAFKYKVKDVWPMYLEEREKEASIPRKGRRLLSKRTLTETKDLYQRHLRPFFAPRKLSEIDDVLWARFVRECEVDDMTNLRKVFGHFCRWAKSSGMMRVLPEFKIPQVQRRERKLISKDQLKAIVSHSDGTLLLFVSMYLFMGIRRGEQMQIRWESISFEGRSLEIRAETSRTRTRRNVPINNYVYDLLVARRKAQVDAGLKTGWVFPKRNNPSEPMSESGINKSWATMIKSAGLMGLDIKPHDLRATYEHYAHLRNDFTDTQREKMAGASIEVQRQIYLNAFGANELRGLEEVVQVEGLGQIITQKTKVQDGENRGN